MSSGGDIEAMAAGGGRWAVGGGGCGDGDGGGGR